MNSTSSRRRDALALIQTRSPNAIVGTNNRLRSFVYKAEKLTNTNTSQNGPSINSSDSPTLSTTWTIHTLFWQSNPIYNMEPDSPTISTTWNQTVQPYLQHGTRQSNPIYNMEPDSLTLSTTWNQTVQPYLQHRTRQSNPIYNMEPDSPTLSTTWNQTVQPYLQHRTK